MDASRVMPGTEKRQMRWSSPISSRKREISRMQVSGSPRMMRFSASRSMVSSPDGRLMIGWGQRKYMFS